MRGYSRTVVRYFQNNIFTCRDIIIPLDTIFQIPVFGVNADLSATLDRFGCIGYQVHHHFAKMYIGSVDIEQVLVKIGTNCNRRMKLI